MLKLRRKQPAEPNPEDLAAALESINAAFAGLTKLFAEIAEIGESVMAASKAFEAAKAAGLDNTEPWPFQPGDVVQDAGTDGDDAVWLHAAPVDTVVVDADGAEWKRLRLRWIRIDDTGIVTSRELANRGPITLVSLGETDPALERGSADVGYLLTFLMTIGLVCFGTGVVVLVETVLS